MYTKGIKLYEINTTLIVGCLCALGIKYKKTTLCNTQPLHFPVTLLYQSYWCNTFLLCEQFCWNL